MRGALSNDLSGRGQRSQAVAAQVEDATEEEPCEQRNPPGRGWSPRPLGVELEDDFSRDGEVEPADEAVFDVRVVATDRTQCDLRRPLQVGASRWEQTVVAGVVRDGGSQARRQAVVEEVGERQALKDRYGARGAEDRRGRARVDLVLLEGVGERGSQLRVDDRIADGERASVESSANWLYTRSWSNTLACSEKRLSNRQGSVKRMSMIWRKPESCA